MRRLIEKEGDELLSPKDESEGCDEEVVWGRGELEEGEDEALGGAVAWFEPCRC